MRNVEASETCEQWWDLVKLGGTWWRMVKMVNMVRNGEQLWKMVKHGGKYENCPAIGRNGEYGYGNVIM